MEPTLAEEIRALLEKRDESRDCDCHRGIENLWDAFPAIAAKMLTVIDERDRFLVAIKEMSERHCDIVDHLMRERENPTATFAAAARIAELKEDSVRWETRYRGAMDELAAARQERDRLRFEAECLQVTVAK